MVKRKLIFLITIITFIFFTLFSNANPNADQWQESDKTYKDLINEGFEVKSYAINNIETANGLYILLFIALIGAYFIEYILGHKPCNLCLLERIPYVLIMCC